MPGGMNGQSLSILALALRDRDFHELGGMPCMHCKSHNVARTFNTYQVLPRLHALTCCQVRHAGSDRLTLHLTIPITYSTLSRRVHDARWLITVTHNSPWTSNHLAIINPRAEGPCALVQASSSFLPNSSYLITSPTGVA